MTFVVELNSNAKRDFYRAQTFCDAEAPDEAARFADEFFATARRLADFPHSSPELRQGARRANLRVCPYQLWYRVRVEAQVVEIIAVVHHRQDRERMGDRL